MKKLFLLLSIACCSWSAWAQAQTEESRLFIRPFRETFVNFPTSVLGTGVRLTVFLPEEKIPLSKQYPLVVFVGLPRNEVEVGESFAQKNEVIFAIVSWEDWATSAVRQPDKLDEFMRRELLPHLETNYPVIDEENARTLVVHGGETEGALLALAHPGTFGKAVFFSPKKFQSAGDFPSVKRIYLEGTPAQLAVAQRTLETAGFEYGPGFALRRIADEENPINRIDMDYLNAPAEQVKIKRLEAFTQLSKLPAQGDESTGLRVVAWLQNGRWFEYVPQQVRFSPPYLAWDALQGTITVLSGAQPGSVKIGSIVDKPKFSTKIKLKKL